MGASCRESFISMEEPVSPATPWRSPVPYFYGGLAAISSLVAFALLILGCSYCWKLSASVLNRDDDAAREADMESGEGKGDGARNPLRPAVFDDKILVIMAGEVSPSSIATPMPWSLDCSKIICRREKAEAAVENGDGGQSQSGNLR